MRCAVLSRNGNPSSWNVVREVEGRLGSLGPFRAEEITALVGAAFVGAESLILLGFDDTRHPMRAALRRVGEIIAMTETSKGDLTMRAAHPHTEGRITATELGCTTRST